MKLKVSLLLVILLIFSLTAHAEPATPLQWLKLVGEAKKELNYHGTFVYAHGDQLESMKVVHASGVNGERERLIHLNGSPREVIRNNDLVTCIFPEDRTVLVAHRSNLATSPFVQAESLAIFEKYYHLSLGERQRIAGLETQTVNLEPKDIYRYGYRFWISSGGLLLRSDLLGADGLAIERIMFAEIHVVDEIPHKMMMPAVNLDGFEWFRQPPPVELSEGRWQIDNLPEGFSLKSRNIRTSDGDASTPVEHLVVSDGLASISVFVEEQGEHAEDRMGSFQVGALNGYGRMVNGHMVVVVGEVPTATVELIAQSVSRDD